MKDDDVKSVISSDLLIKREAELRIASLGRKSEQKHTDMHRVSGAIRTLDRIVINARGEVNSAEIDMDYMVKPGNVDLVVKIAKKRFIDQKSACA